VKKRERMRVRRTPDIVSMLLLSLYAKKYI